MLALMARQKKSQEPTVAPKTEKKPQPKSNIPNLEPRLKAWLLTRDPIAESNAVFSKLKKTPVGIPPLIQQIITDLDELDTASAQYRYLKSLKDRGILTDELYTALDSANANSREKNAEDRDHELAVRRYIRRADRRRISIQDDGSLQQNLRASSHEIYRKVRNYITNALISKLLITLKSPAEQKKLLSESTEPLSADGLIEISGILFGNDQKKFLAAFKSAFEIAVAHESEVPDEFAEHPSFPAVINFLQSSLSTVLADERRKHAFGEHSQYSVQKLDLLEDQLQTLEEMIHNLRKNESEDTENLELKSSFEKDRSARQKYIKLPAIRELQEEGNEAFTRTSEEEAASLDDLILDIQREQKNYYRQLSEMFSIATPEAHDVLQRIKTNNVVLKQLEMEKTVTPIPKAEEFPASEELRERKYLNIQHQLRIKNLQAEIDELQEELRSLQKGTKENARLRPELQQEINARLQRMEGYHLLEQIGNAREQLAFYRSQLAYLEPSDRRTIQDAIPPLLRALRQLSDRYDAYQQNRLAREAAQHERWLEKRRKDRDKKRF